MKKQIKDLNWVERLCICSKYAYNKCTGCPFLLEFKDEDAHICVHHILNVLEKEVEV